MQKILYIICLLSYFQSTALGSSVSENNRNPRTALGLFPRLASPLLTTQILDLHEEITDAKASDCYKLYEEELKDKTKKELNRLLERCFIQSNDQRPLYRQKMIAILHVGARLSKTSLTSTSLDHAIACNDVPFARYICTHYPENPNEMGGSETPLWFLCRSPEMAQLMIAYGADLGTKESGNNIIHSLCGRYRLLNAPLVQCYCTERPALLDELDSNGYTPLECVLKRLSTTTIQNAYLLFNLRLKTDSSITIGKNAKNAELVRCKAQEQKDEKNKNKFLALAEYIEHQPKLRISLFQPLLEQLNYLQP